MVGLRFSSAGATGNTEAGRGSMVGGEKSVYFSAQEFWIDMMSDHWTNTKRDGINVVVAAGLDTSRNNVASRIRLHIDR